MQISRWLMGVVVVSAAVAGHATTKSIAGVWRPGLQHGKLSAKEMATVKQAKAKMANGSLKLHKDKTFGCVLLGKVMFGTWSYDGKTLTLNVKEMVGYTTKQVAAMPVSTRVAKMVMKNGKLYSLPLATREPQVVWKKIG